MWKNTVERVLPRMTICSMGIPCWIPKVTNTHSSCVTLTAFPPQQLHERSSMLRYTYIVCIFGFWYFIYIYIILITQRKTKSHIFKALFIIYLVIFSEILQKVSIKPKHVAALFC